MSTSVQAPVGHVEVDAGIRRLVPQPQPMRYVGVATGLGACACVGVGILSVGDPSAAYGIGGASAVVSAGALVAAERARQRAEITDHLTEQVCPAMALGRPARAAVRLSKWSGGFVGQPARVQLIYHASVVPDMEWLGKVVHIVQTSLGGRYTIARHHERKHRLWLEMVTEDADQVPTQAPVVERTTTVVQELLGESARVQVDMDDDGQAQRITVRHNQGTNMAFGNKRQRVERVMATRIPGDWVPKWDLQNDVVEFVTRVPMPTLVLLPTAHSPLATTHEDYSDFQIPLGIDEDNEQLSWTPRKQPHAVVVGTT
ncbi:hypothetical protein, partial [Dermacoccus nishinomiyaensis]|uniref:hypothetical protein n=1 Tax=Dermacoccus nishinomiyaensis TaxID=1274 RepID=UPI00248EBEFE